jgi:hypothetical protein
MDVRIINIEMCGEHGGWTPQNHKAQEGVSRGQWLIPLAIKPQWACIIWREP